MTGHTLTFRLPATAYEAIMHEAVSRGDNSTLSLESREALSTAAPLSDGVWVVDCTDEVSQDIEDWFAMAAIVESATPKGCRPMVRDVEQCSPGNPGWQSKDSPRGKMSEDTRQLPPRQTSPPRSGLNQGAFNEDSPSEAKGGGRDRFSVAAAMDVLHAPTRRR